MPSDYFLVRAEGKDENSPTDVLVYLLPGNPGLVVYYRDFINYLNDILSSKLDKVNYTLAGRSLAGFELEDIQAQQESLILPFNLQQQCENVHARIRTAVANAQGEDKAVDEKPKKKLPVILIGHSVGCYMLLEVLSKRQSGEQSSTPGVGDAESRYEIIGGINLFPTIVDLAKSPRGKRAAPLFWIPLFATIVHFMAGILWLFVPEPWIIWLIRKITGMPADPARTTNAFLGSRTGVEASLYLAGSELLEMQEDKWPDTLWTGAADIDPVSDPGIDKPNLYFYWAENDHWIDNQTRNNLIAKRARQLDKAKTDSKERSKPKMEIDGNGIPHDFCLRHSKPIAEKVAEYIEEIVKERM